MNAQMLLCPRLLLLLFPGQGHSNKSVSAVVAAAATMSCTFADPSAIPSKGLKRNADTGKQCLGREAQYQNCTTKRFLQLMQLSLLRKATFKSCRFLCIN